MRFPEEARSLTASNVTGVGVGIGVGEGLLVGEALSVEGPVQDVSTKVVAIRREVTSRKKAVDD